MKTILAVAVAFCLLVILTTPVLADDNPCMRGEVLVGTECFPADSVGCYNKEEFRDGECQLPDTELVTTTPIYLHGRITIPAHIMQIRVRFFETYWPE